MVVLFLTLSMLGHLEHLDAVGTAHFSDRVSRHKAWHTTSHRLLRYCKNVRGRLSTPRHSRAPRYHIFEVLAEEDRVRQLEEEKGKVKVTKSWVTKAE
jgi:hypothetical protein